MALDTGFVGAVLEGIEGTLGELIERGLAKRRFAVPIPTE